jgi:hypothetical protein
MLYFKTKDKHATIRQEIFPVRHGARSIRLSLASGADTALRVQLVLAHDPDYSVRMSLAENECTAPEVLCKLAEPRPDNCGFPDHVVRAVARNKSTPKEISFMLFCQHPEWVK